MKPAWDKLMTEYKGNKDVLIGDCDCTADGKSLCEEVGVQGYPTIKYGDPSALEDYQGGRDFDILKKHAETKLKPSCSPTNLHLCDDAKKADLEKEISGKEAEISEAEKTFKSEVEKLQAAYKKLQQTKEDTIKNVKDSGLGLLKAVKAANKKK